MLTESQKSTLRDMLMKNSVPCFDIDYPEVVKSVEEFIDFYGFKVPTFSERITEDSAFTDLPPTASIDDEKNAGIEQGYMNAKAQWKATALEIVRRTAEHFAMFTVNDFRDELKKTGVKTHDNRAIAGIMRTAQAREWIKPSGETIRSRVGHGGPLIIWQSLICKRNQPVQVAVTEAEELPF